MGESRRCNSRRRGVLDGEPRWRGYVGDMRCLDGVGAVSGEGLGVFGITSLAMLMVARKHNFLGGDGY
jgi:hypothetical protein